MKMLCLLLVLMFCLGILAPAAQAEQLHFALRAKDQGPCRRLSGDVVILVVLVNTPKHPWTDAQRQAVQDVSWSSLDYMIKNVTEVVEYLRSFSPVWRDLMSGKTQFIL